MKRHRIRKGANGRQRRPGLAWFWRCGARVRPNYGGRLIGFVERHGPGTIIGPDPDWWPPYYRVRLDVPILHEDGRRYGELREAGDNLTRFR